MSTVRSLCLLLAGAATHVCYFHRFEHHMFGTRYLQILLIFATIHTANNIITKSTSLPTALLHCIIFVLPYFIGLTLSLTTYRLLFSPLKAFPGPFGAKISNLWFSLHLGSRDAQQKLLALHETYGYFVRIGSSDLSIVHPKAVQAIYGPQSRCTKADWYDLTLPMVSMQTTRNRALHDQRRRIWSRAFGEQSLRGYERRIAVFQDQLVRKVVETGRNPINVTELLHLYGFDVMGDLAFGESFNMLKDSKSHWAVKMMNEAMVPMGFMLPTWMFRLLTAIPFAARGWWQFISYCHERLDTRINVCVAASNEKLADADFWSRISQSHRIFSLLCLSRTMGIDL
jgi:hypothetical protein